jgi:hypothetical protein
MKKADESIDWFERRRREERVPVTIPRAPPALWTALLSWNSLWKEGRRSATCHASLGYRRA